MSYSSIATKLAAILETVKTAPGSKLAKYYTYEEPTSDETPYGSIVTGSLEEKALDTVSNEATYKYVLRFVDTNRDKSVMEETMRTLADQVLAELRKAVNETLGGEAVRVYPFTVTWGWETTNQTPIRFFEVSVEVVETFDK